MNKSYRVGRYVPKKKSYTMQPKRRIGLSPTEIEIKINRSDLQNIKKSASANDPNIPPPIWNFVTSRELGANTIPSKSIHDIIGCIVYYGRWERERCFDDFHKPTGQFWVRLWLIMVDHSSESSVKVQLYIDFSGWEKLGKYPNTKLIYLNVIFNLYSNV